MKIAKGSGMALKHQPTKRYDGFVPKFEQMVYFHVKWYFT